MKIISYLLISIPLLLISCTSHNTKPGGSGLLETDESVISAETSGRVQQLFFDEGTTINAHDTLLIIDPSRLELALASAEANYEVAQRKLEAAKLQREKAKETGTYTQKEYKRVLALFKSGTANQKQLDLIEHQLSLAKLAVQTAQNQIATGQAELNKINTESNRIKRSLEDCYPVAPISGIVTEKYVEKGELLAPGKPMVKISDLSSLWVKVYLPSGDFAHVKIGDQATVDTEAGGEKYKGTVIWTSEEAEFTPKNVETKESRANLVYAVKVRITNTDGRLKIGMPVYVTIDQ